MRCQVCYGVSEVPRDDWYCDPCAARRPVKRPTCPACPNRGGALKCTKEGKWGGFAHVLCTLYLPETGFLEPATLGQAAGFDLIPQARQGLRCSLPGCPGPREGYKVQCAHGNCVKAFHVTCAERERLHMEMGDANLIFCQKHTPRAPAAPPKKKQRRRSGA